MACVVNITGTGHATYCYATVNDTKYSSAKSGISLTSNTIVFAVVGGNGGSTLGTVTIDGEVVSSTSNPYATQSYTWSVPNNVSLINIVLNDTGQNSTITVTTGSGSGGGSSGGSGGSHKTLIGGTAYEISGGRPLVGGTAYSIAKGKTMVDGTAYEIVFSSPVMVNITGYGNSSYCYATINGTKYSSSTTLEIEVGTEIQFFASSTQALQRKNAKITLNGSVVSTGSSGSSGGGASYTLAPDCAVVNVAMSYTNYGTITITTS